MPAVDGPTIDDIEDMPEYLRVELHNGNLVVKALGTLWHEKIAEAIVVWFAFATSFCRHQPRHHADRAGHAGSDVGRLLHRAS
jgi:hypothetical protein